MIADQTPRENAERGEGGRGQTLRRLKIVGALSVLIYGIVAVLSFRFRYGEDHPNRPILLILGLFGMAWGLYAFALFSLLRRRPERDDLATRRGGLRCPRIRAILWFAIVFRLLLLASNPIQEIDYCRYLWDGRVLLEGINPFKHSPAEIDESGNRLQLEADSSAESRLGKLRALTRRSESIRTIYERVHHREVPTIYPPVAQLVFAFSALMTPADSPVWVHILVLKALLAGFDLGTLIMLARLLLRVGWPAELCLAYGWSPLVLKEFANSAHLDTIAVFFTTLGMYWLAGASSLGHSANGETRQSSLRPKSAMAALGAAVLAKSYPVVFLPIVFGYLIGRLRARAAIPICVLVAVVAVGYAPFVGGDAPSPSRSSSPPPPPSHTPWTGLGTFLTRWQKNDFAFMIAHENLRAPIEGVRDRWFVLVPPKARDALTRRVLERWIGPFAGGESDPSFLATQIVMGSLVAGLSLFWAVRVGRDPDPERLLRAVGLVLAWGWLLSGTPHPWYLIWSLPFLIFIKRGSWFLMTGLAFLYYMRFWFEYQASPLGLEAVEEAFDWFDYGFVWFEYLPFFAILVAESLWSRVARANGNNV